MTEINMLIARRGQLKASLTRLATYLRDNASEIDVDQIRLRAEKARDVWEDFQQIQIQIEAVDGECEEAEKYRIEFEELYFKNLAKCEKMSRASNISTESVINNVPISISDRQGSHGNLQSVQSATKLAAIQIPVFNGSYTEWAMFYDIFSALVHNNETLTDIQRFFYLRSSLKGDAENVIKCLQTTASNYKIAWDSLIARYDNKKVIIQTHIQALFDLEPVKRESSLQLRKLMDSLTGHLKVLESAGEEPQKWGALLLYLIASKLDPKTLKEWEIMSTKIQVPSSKELLDFLQSRFRVLEAVESSIQINASQDQNRKTSTIKRSFIRSNAFVAASEIKCYLCKQAHTIYRCPSFLSLSVSDRIKKASELKLCKICLRLHDGEKCQSRRCPICARPHNSLLHLPSLKKPEKTINQPANASLSSAIKFDEPTNEATAAISINAHTYHKNNINQILLSTATVIAHDNERLPVLCRVLLDSGSQHNFVTESMVQNLHLKRAKASCSVIGINGSTHTASHLVTTTIKSRVTNYTANLNFFVLPKLTAEIPLMPVNVSSLNLPTDLILADPSFDKPQPIDMILGAEIFFDLIRNEQIRPVARGPVLQNTQLGWIVAGPTTNYNNHNKFPSVSLAAYASLETLESKISDFWRLEELRPEDVMTPEERVCKHHFESNVRRSEDGRFVVLLPFRDTVKLGKSYGTALRRFLSLERRFQSDESLRTEYVKCINEYITLGHMSIASNAEPSERGYYLPHHAVHKASSTSTKLRVVFDASAKTDTGLSLNDVLLKGPTIQEELVSIMSRFRTHRYVIAADIKKMYRQIWVAENQRDYQRILWRGSPDKPITTYCLNTVTYGVITASYLATACLKKLSEEETLRYPEACYALSHDFYVDDFLGGAATLTEARKLQTDLITILKTAGLELCKWSSNEPDLLTDVAALKACTGNSESDNTEEVTKILGIYWNQHEDIYQYKVLPYDEDMQVTKRVILSEIASIFDPLGLISPVIIRFKIIMQKLWLIKTEWDKTLPPEIESEWRNNRRCLAHLNSIKIERSIIGNGEIATVELHGFADASACAYGACLYLRVTHMDGTRTVRLICSKSRVAPLKTVSIPRLELLAAVLLARLSSKYAPNLRLLIENKYYWSDSTVVLAWISSQSSKWKTFVANRVGEIHELTSINQWGHVSTEENPADIVSRGCCPSQVKNMDMWWTGPNWLIRDRAEWPKQNVATACEDTEVMNEKRTTACCLSSVKKIDLSIFDKYSTLTKLIRVVAYCMRFFNNTSAKGSIVRGPILASEYHESTMRIVKLVQLNDFQQEISDLKNNRPLRCKSPLLRLRPFLDENGLVRVGGRLKNASTIDIFQRHPIVLPAKSHFTKLLFSYEHESLLHGGPQAMLASIRLKYWPLNGRNIARSVVHRCVICFKYRPVVMEPIMGDLPRSRVEPARAFKKAGVDFAGPFYVKTSLRRNAAVSKSYACVWVCLVTKAIHIELVGDLTTQSFLNALQRFCDRRGLCTDIYSDNATNFVGANRRLQEIRTLFSSAEHREKIQDALTKNGIQWHFIPPRSPHFGGLWEAAVKSLKAHLYKTLGNASLTFEELNTLLVRVEAILNSRPLTPISTDPSDSSFLTPAHFLIGESLRALPDRDETGVPVNRLSRWRRVTQISQHFWARWSKDYLSQLQVRAKWSSPLSRNLQVGTVVLIRDDNLPPLQWSLGRVISINSGEDNQVRVVTIKTKQGEFKRAARYLCPLPFEGNLPDDN